MADPSLQVNNSTSGLHLCAHGTEELLSSGVSSPTLPGHLAQDSLGHVIHSLVRYVQEVVYFCT